MKNLPNDMLTEIDKYLDDKSRARLSQTSKNWNKITKPRKEEQKKKMMKRYQNFREYLNWQTKTKTSDFHQKKYGIL